MKQYKIKAIIKRKDALTINKKYKYIATDLPYGKNTKSQDLSKLYESFIKNIKNQGFTIGVIGFPNHIPLKKILNKHKLKYGKVFTFYLNKTLTRNIIVVKP